MGVLLRQAGTTATMSPRLKRSSHTMSDGRGVSVVIDTNRSDANGGDTTGTAKIFVYLSADTGRGTWPVSITYTPAVAPSSSTKWAVATSALANNNNLYVVYQGTDNSLRMITWVWGGSSWGAGSEQTIIAANAVTNRFRAVDMDIAQDSSRVPAVIVYEANASTGQGAWIRVYGRLTDNTTWRKAWELNILTTQFIKSGTEDVSIAMNKAGLVSNVGKCAIFYTVASTIGDNGDTIRNIAFNFASGAAGSGTIDGTWTSNINKSTAVSSRRAWLFSETTDQWIFAGTVGTTSAQFQTARIKQGTYTAPQINARSIVFSAAQPESRLKPLIQPMLIDMFVTACCQVSSVYFVFSGSSTTSDKRIARSVVMRFDPVDFTNKSAVWVDTSPRVHDNAFLLEDGVVQVSGGSNSNHTIANFNCQIWYGSDGNSVSASPTTLPRKVYLAIEQALSAPTFESPKVNPAVNTPTMMAKMQHNNLYCNVLGKFHWQWATDPGFTANVKDIIENDAKFSSYSSTDGTSRPIRTGVMVVPTAQKFTQSGVWYGRVRMLDDMGFWSSWSDTEPIVLSHPPTALNATPINGSVSLWGTGDTIFSWRFSDTEPTDTQSAYRVIVTRVDTGVTVNDTGKVTSSNNYVSIDIASTLIGIPLQWTVQLWDLFDTAGATSNPSLFTMYEAPIPVITSPADGATINTGLPTITWTFNASGGRVQRAYRVRIYNVDVSPALQVADTGWIMGTETSYTFLASVLTNLTTFWPVVEVQDNFGLYGGTFYNVLNNTGFEQNALGWSITGGTIARDTNLTDASIGSLKVTPTGGVAIAVRSDFVPTLHDLNYEMVVRIIAPGGLVGKAFTYGLANYDSAGALLTSGGNVDSAIPPAIWVTESASDSTDSVVSFVGANFEVASSVVAGDIFYLDNVDLHQWPINFDTDYNPPALGDVSLFPLEHYIQVFWTDANTDPDFVSWRVYRRYMKPASSDLDVDDTANRWVLAYETTDNSTANNFYDYLAPLNKSVDYVVVQVADRFGSLVESDITSHSTTEQYGDRYFFVPKIPIGTIASFEASSVVGDSFTREIEQETIHVIQRGRQVQVGDDLGYSGSLSIKLRNPASARFDREFFEYLSGPNSSNVYVKSPFGDVILISIGSVSAQRLAGVGQTDMSDLTVPYVEVFDDEQVTRSDF